MATTGINSAIGSNLTVLNNATFGDNITDKILVNGVSTFNEILTANQITDKLNITSTGNIQCDAVFTCENLNCNFILSGFFSNSTVTDTSIANNVTISGVFTPESNITFSTASYSKSTRHLGYLIALNFGIAPMVINRELTSGSVFNVASLSALKNGVYLVYYKCTLSRLNNDTTTLIKFYEMTLSTTSTSEILASNNNAKGKQVTIDQSFNNKMSISGTQFLTIDAAQSDVHFNIRVTFDGAGLNVLGSGTYGSLSALKIG